MYAEMVISWPLQGLGHMQELFTKLPIPSRQDQVPTKMRFVNLRKFLSCMHVLILASTSSANLTFLSTFNYFLKGGHL
jgi:hypothetical protein